MAKTETTAKALDSCPSPLKINVIGINSDLKRAIIFNPRCKKWSCPYCAELNAESWRFVGFRGASLLVSEGLTLRFITVTSRPYATPNQSLHYFAQNWPKLVRRANYHTNKVEGQKWSYYLIPEQHKTGVLHAHLIASTNLKTRWWKDNAYACGFGYMAESEPISEPALAIGYINKYLSKSIQYTRWPKGFRRVRTSRNWPKEPSQIMPGWEWSTHSDESAWFEYYLLKDYGYDVRDNRTKPEQ
jgi:hypothetical protein